jgi:hypothetical protein
LWVTVAFDAYPSMAHTPIALGGLLAAASTVLWLVPAAATISAQQSKTTVCHRTGNASFQPVTVADPAMPTHIAHGDGVVGGAVPDQSGYKFDSECRAVPANTDGTACNDGNACTVYDRFQGGVCIGAPIIVDDANACTMDACNPATGAVTHTPVSVDDGNACTIDVCDASGAVSHVADGSDRDLDGIPDCQDVCPDVYAYEASHDRDADGTLDCADACPDAPGGDGDADADGVADCNDVCPAMNDAIGAVDQDGDGVVDCEDFCPQDPCRAEPANGACQPVSDADGDGLASCQDPCPDDATNACLGGSFFRVGGGSLPPPSTGGDPIAVLLPLAVFAYRRLRTRRRIR